jgi:hypothetical protein
LQQGQDLIQDRWDGNSSRVRDELFQLALSLAISIELSVIDQGLATRGIGYVYWQGDIPQARLTRIEDRAALVLVVSWFRSCSVDKRQNRELLRKRRGSMAADFL